jgi:Chitinase
MKLRLYQKLEVDMMRRKFITFLLGFVLIGSAALGSVPSVLADEPGAHNNNYRQNNITYMNPEWVMYPQSDAFIRAKVNQMKQLKIKYQMIDVGFFDKIAGTNTFDDQKGGAIDGSMDPAAYARLAQWVKKCRVYDPDMKLIASVNGNQKLHIQTKVNVDRNGSHTPIIDKTAMHAKIAEFCGYLIANFGLDGINLDFEPISAGEPGKDYRQLIQEVRKAIGNTKQLSICGNIFETAMPDPELQQYAPLLDMMVIMDYDTADQGDSPYPDDDYTTNKDNYQLAIKENVIRISKVLRATGCELVPMGPGKYANNEWHPAYENAMNHSIAVNDAIAAGALVAGSGIWWFDGVSKDAGEMESFLKYWVHGATE